MLFRAFLPLRILLFLLLFPGAGSLRAELAVDGFSALTSLQPTGTVGWQFTTTERIQVEALGVMDAGGDGLREAHQVGIWDATGTSLLASATVQSGTASTPDTTVMQNSLLRYELISPVVLVSGQTYIIGASYDNDDLIFTNFNSFSSSTSLTGISGLSGGAGFSVPTTPSSSALLGPNFLLSPIPEPTSFLMFSCASLLVVRRRR
ncbi:MAG: hypothetical protein AAF456_05775 [Planctomycetota bacterium]